MKVTDGALLALFDEHHRQLFRFACRLTGSPADAEEIVQECFLSLLRPGCEFDPARTAARAYLFGAARNQALKRLRQRAGATDGAPEPAAAGSPETVAQQAEIARSVAAAVLALPPNQRDVLLLAHYEQMSLAEIAAALQIELGAVKSRLQRARASLRERLAVYAGEVEKR